MNKTSDIGLAKTKEGFWYYRIKTTLENGKKVDTTGRRDEDGKPFILKKACRQARNKKWDELQLMKEEISVKVIGEETLNDIWEIFITKDAKGKAYSTVLKYQSVWKNHIKNEFGHKKITEISNSEMGAFLAEKYADGLAFAYVQSFLKLFYLLYGIAYREMKINQEQYTRMFLDKGTRLRMPSQRREETGENRVFKSSEIKAIFEVVEGTNLETAFMFGYYCGLRVSEVFGLMWSDINWTTGTIKVCRQLNYEDGVYCIGPVKTLAGNRELEMPKILIKHLEEKYKEYKEVNEKISYRNYEIVLDKTKNQKGAELKGGAFINRKKTGELLTINSIKCYSKKIKQEKGIQDFKFHSMRKTHLTQLAAKNTPIYELKKRAGHKKLETTMKFYLSSNSESKQVLLQNLESLNIEDAVSASNVIEKDVDYFTTQSEAEKNNQIIKLNECAMIYEIMHQNRLAS